MTDISLPDDRALLLQEVAGRAAPSLRPASLVSPEPIRPLPPALLAKLERRAQAGFDPVTGADHPRRERLQVLVVLPLVVALLAAVVTSVAFVTDHHLPGVIAAVVGVAGLAVAAAGRSWVRADPLRITTTEGRLIDRAGFWQSSQPWTGALNTGPERALLGLAVDSVTRIAINPAWTSGYLDGHRQAFDLAGELDGIDAQLCQVAAARTSGGANEDLDSALDAGLDRVLALRRYELNLLALAERVAGLDAELRATPALAELRGSADQTRFATEGVQRLTDELGVIISSVDQMAAELRRDRP